MKDSKTLFAEFLQSNPHPEQLSEDRLRSMLSIYGATSMVDLIYNDKNVDCNHSQCGTIFV